MHESRLNILPPRAARDNGRPHSIIHAGNNPARRFPPPRGLTRPEPRKICTHYLLPERESQLDPPARLALGEEINGRLLATIDLRS